jgi:uncharacterized repeat protein (TIGR02543 family)
MVAHSVKYEVTVVVSPNAGSGSGGGFYLEGDNATVSYHSFNYYVFVGWYTTANCETSSLVSTDEIYTFIVGADVTLYARCEKGPRPGKPIVFNCGSFNVVGLLSLLLGISCLFGASFIYYHKRKR